MPRARGKKLYTPEELALKEREKKEERPAWEVPGGSSGFSMAAAIPIPPREHDRVMDPQSAEDWVKLARVGKILRSDLTEPQAVLIVLKGKEVGIPPLRALEHIYLAENARDGNRFEFVMQAELMRALVRERGLGAIEPDPQQSTDQIGVVRAIRQDALGRREAVFTYTLEDARKDGLLIRPEWRTTENRKAKLWARATSQAWRALFADASAGLGYAPEDLPGPGTAPVHPSPEAAGTATAPERPSPLPPAPPAGGDTPESVGAKDSPPPAPADPAGTAPKPRERWFHAWDTIETPGHPSQPILTNGITLETARAILNYSIEARAFAQWRDALERVTDYLAQLGIEEHSVTWLTADEGTALLSRLQEEFGEWVPTPPSPVELTPPPAPPAPAPPPPADAKTEMDAAVKAWLKAKQRFEAMIARHELGAHRGVLEQMVAHVAGVKTLHEVPPEKFEESTDSFDRYAEQGVIVTLVAHYQDLFMKEGSGAAA